MCSLKSPMSLVLSNTSVKASVKALPVQIFVGGGGGGALDPPAPLLRHLCMDTCYCLKGIGEVLSKLCFIVLRWIVNISEHKSRPYACLAILTKKPLSLEDLIILQR